MTMPLDLVLVRHGESEGNVAFGLSRRGDHSHFTPEFLARHSSKWRLTEQGEQQARAAGAWLRAHLTSSFDRYYVAEYLRAMETAAHLGFDDAVWRCEFYLRERDWGVFDVMSYQERRQRYGEDLRRRAVDTFFWTPPGGESMAEVDWDITWRPGTRRADRASIRLTPASGDPLTVVMEPLMDFQMLGLGYLHPTWGHGVWKGEHATEVERWRVDELDPMAPQHLHVQQLCRATAGARTGIGILEILAIGPHAPAGFTELLDPARG